MAAPSYFDIIGAKDNTPGAEQGNPSALQYAKPEPRPVYSSQPLERLQAPTLGERLGEAIIRGASASYNRAWAETQEEMYATYKTEAARVAAERAYIREQEAAIRKSLLDMDEADRTRASRAGDSELDSALDIARLRLDQAKAIAQVQGDSQDRRLKAMEIANDKYRLTPEMDTTLGSITGEMKALIDAGMTPDAAMQSMLTRMNQSGNWPKLNDPSATTEERKTASAALLSAATSMGVSDRVARSTTSALVGTGAVDASQLQAEKEAAIARASSGLGVGTGGIAGIGVGQVDASVEDTVDVVETWAASRAGQLTRRVMADGRVTPAEQAEIDALAAEIKDKTPGVNGEKVDPDLLGDYRRMQDRASVPAVAAKISTNLVRDLDPRRIERRAQLAALGEEYAALEDPELPTAKRVREATIEQRAQARFDRKVERGNLPPAKSAFEQIKARAKSPEEARVMLAFARAQKAQHPEGWKANPRAEEIHRMIKGGHNEYRDPKKLVTDLSEWNEDSTDQVLEDLAYLMEVERTARQNPTNDTATPGGGKPTPYTDNKQKPNPPPRTNPGPGDSADPPGY